MDKFRRSCLALVVLIAGIGLLVMAPKLFPKSKTFGIPSTETPPPAAPLVAFGEVKQHIGQRVAVEGYLAAAMNITCGVSKSDPTQKSRCRLYLVEDKQETRSPFPKGIAAHLAQAPSSFPRPAHMDYVTSTHFVNSDVRVHDSQLNVISVGSRVRAQGWAILNQDETGIAIDAIEMLNP